MKKISLVGIYSYLDELLDGIKKVKEKLPERMVVYSPIPNHDIDEAMEKKISRVRYFTLFGALSGCTVGFAIAIWSSLKYGLITGGKQPVEITPFVVIGFETTFLFGAICTLIGLAFMNHISSYRIKNTYDERFSNDKYGIALTVLESEKEDYVRILNATGAEEVNVR